MASLALKAEGSPLVGFALSIPSPFQRHSTAFEISPIFFGAINSSVPLPLQPSPVVGFGGCRIRCRDDQNLFFLDVERLAEVVGFWRRGLAANAKGERSAG